MEKLLRMAFMALSLLVCTGIWAATDVSINLATDPWNCYGGTSLNSTYNITYTGRTFEANTWEILCLPFDANSSQIDNAFGADNYELMAYDRVDNSYIVFMPMATPAIEAGKPYAIRLKTETSTMTFPNVTMKTFTETAVGTDNLKCCASLTSKATWWFNESQNNVTGKSYLLEKGLLSEIGYGKNENTILPTSAYFNSADGSNIKVSFGDDFYPQISNLPTIYLEIPDVVDIDQDLKKVIHKDGTPDEAPYHKTTIRLVDKNGTLAPFVDEGLQIKVRGNSTALEAQGYKGKKAYRMKFDKDKKDADGNVIETHKHDLLGKGYKKRNWVLLANYFDKSMLRNALTSNIATAAGMPFAPGYCFVDLVINGDYRGTYQISDHVEIGSKRIPLDDEDNDWYVEFQGRQDMLDYPMVVDNGILLNINNPEPADEDDETQRNEIINMVGDWFNNTWAKGFEESNIYDETTGWRAYNDEYTLLRFMLVTDLTADWDGLMSVKAYRPVNGKLFWGPVWDKDLAYGNYGNIDKTLCVNITGNGSSVQTKLQGVFKDSKFLYELSQLMDNMVADGLKEKLTSEIDNLANTIAQSRELDVAKWGVTQKSIETLYGQQDYSYYTTQLKTWISDRIDFVQSEYRKLSAQYPYVPTEETSFVFDANNATADYSSKLNKTFDITIKNRTLSSHNWNTISFPFDLTLEQLKNVFGNETKLMSVVSVNGTTVTFGNATVLEAGVPYMLKPEQSVTDPSFKDVTVETFDNKAVALDNVGSFISCIRPTTMATDGSELFMTTSGLFAQPTANGNVINGTRAYLKLYDQKNAKAISFVFDDTATGISEMKGISTLRQGNVYNINGQRVNSSAKYLKGIYIIDGKKIVIQ